LPGYPASHGCIRMPMAFAMKMWNWTRMGARVIVAPGQMSPQNFSHPLLASVRVPPQPAASLAPQINAGDKADKGAAQTNVTEGKISEAKPVETKTASADSVIELRTSVGHTVMSDVTTGNAPAREDAAPADKVETRVADASDAAKPSSDVSAKPASTGAKPIDAAEAPKASTTTNKSDAAKTEAPALATSPDVKKDETRMADPAPAAKPDAPKRAGQIAVFISRKDSKLYVRQNFAPLFEVPVTIAPSDRPLGTHVFTAEVDKADSNTLRWSVVSLPVSVRAAARNDDGPVARRKGGAAVIPVAAKPVVTPDSPAEALDRITIPADTMAKINEMLTTGGSIIVSDQGINQGETGEGTDFIVRLY
jgi:hypothetical protein